ncbi:MAG: NAD+ synthase, partial [Deltaproteobacteria bacterium]
LALTGYPPEDLLLRADFCEENEKTLRSIAREVGEELVIVGFVRRDDFIYNSAALITGGKVAATYDKIHLPNYAVFDEYRYFARGERPLVVTWGDTRLGITICEDIWYPDGPHVAEAASGAEVIINISASPYHRRKWLQRERMISTRASDVGAWFLFCNMTGGQDELVFDGGSCFVSEEGEVVSRLPLFQEAVGTVTIDTTKVFRTRLHDPRIREESEAFFPDATERITLRKKVSPPAAKGDASLSPPPGEEEEIFRALVTGTHDYVRKNGFRKVVIGLSGGIDSSLVACIAAEAVGRKNVVGVAMPSLISSRESVEDARTLADNLGIEFHVIPIWDIFDSFKDALEPLFRGLKEDVTEENLQARIRGMLLMALSNKFGYLVLTTGNKSEMSVGYATLYGDMAGGFAVIKDVYKTMVYRLARFYNSLKGKPVIPERVLIKPPSAELRPGQTDQDSLPPYEILDPILSAYIEEDCSIEEIVRRGFDRQTVRRVIAMVDGNEYKRRQAPPGVRITPRALGKDRRMPIVNRFFR